MAPRRYVQPPAATPLPSGLLAVAEPRFDEPDQHWQGGVTWQENCGVAASWWDTCIVSGSGQVDGKTATHERGSRGAEPFTVYAEIDCNPVGFWDDAQTEAAAALTFTEGWQVERTFWTGIAAGIPDAIHPHLAADATVVDGDSITLQTAASVVVTGAVDIVEGLGRLEQELGDCYPGQGVIHVPAVLAPALANAGLLVRDGLRWRTHNGNLAAVGAGYPGTGPGGTADDGVAWMYATGAVFVYRSAATSFRREQSLDRTANLLKMIAERQYLLGWECCHLAIPISLGGIITGTYGAAT